MKAYVVWYDNGESYEDNLQCIERIFSSREKAEAYLADLEKFDDRVFDFIPCVKWKQPKPKHRCEKVIKAFNEDGESCFNTCYYCDKADDCELEEKWKSWYYNQYATWEIQEWDMDAEE